MFNFGAKPNPKIAVVPPKIRVEKAAAPQKPQPLPSKIASKIASRPSPRPQEYARLSPKPRRASSTPDRLEPRKRKPTRQKSPAQQRLESDSEEDSVGSRTSFDAPIKRHKPDKNVDLKRELRSKSAYSKEGIVFPMIHATDIAAPARKSKHVSGPDEKNVTVELQYPSVSQRERYDDICEILEFLSRADHRRYDLVFGPEQINPTDEIYKIATKVVNVYLTEEEALPFTEPNSGILRKLERAKNLLSKDIQNKKLLDGFKDAVDIYNTALETLVNNETISKNLDSMHHLPFDTVHLILRQIYDRAVSPNVDILKQTKNKENKDNTYGELLSNFTNMIIEQTHLKSDQVFVDLGSGVGNVVLQMALQVGCESWGCEMMPNPCDLADTAKKEFTARCRLWGIKPGEVRLERDDFTRNAAIHEAIKRADVILVNNEVFSESLNGTLVQLFLDVKDNCKIVSLRPLASSDSTIKSRTLNDPSNLFEVVQKQYSENFVSWKADGGNYYISTKDSKRLERFSQLG